MHAGDSEGRAWFGSFVRIGGAAGLLVAVIGIGINYVLAPATTPDFHAPLSEILTWVDGIWAEYGYQLVIANGLRYTVYFLLPIFGVGLYEWVARERGVVSSGWGTTGVLGAVAVGAVGTLANAAETIALWRVASLAEQPELAMMLWSLSSVLFTAVMWTWALFLIGFSVAGWLSGVMPRWLVGLGVVGGGAALLAAAGVSSVVAGGMMTVPWIASLTVFPIWVLGASILMVRHPAQGVQSSNLPSQGVFAG